MKKYTGIIIFIVLIIIFQFLSGIFHKFAEKKLQTYIQSKLPPGSMISNVKWNILSLLSAQDIKINTKDFILITKEMRFNYTLFALFHRHIRSITMISPEIKIKNKKKGKHKKGILNYPVFSIDNLNIMYGTFERNGIKINITASGKIKSTKQKLYIYIFRGGGIYKNTKFSGIKGKITGNNQGIKITDVFIKMKNGNINIIRGLFSGEKSKMKIKYQGNLRDFNRLIPRYILSGKLKTNIAFQSIGKNYDIKANGSGKGISIQDYRLGDFTFDIKKKMKNSARFSFNRKDIKIKGGKDSTNIFADITMKNLSLYSFNKHFPETSITGNLHIFSLKNVHDISFSGKLRNNNIKITDIHGNIIRNKHQWTSDGIHIQSGTGKIQIKGTLNGQKNVYLTVKNFPLRNIFMGIKKIPFSGALTGNISLKNKNVIIGDFGIKNFRGKGVMCNYAGGNINIADSQGDIDIAFVSPSAGKIHFKTGYLHFSIKNEYKFNGFMKGDNLKLQLDGNGKKIKNTYKLALNHLSFVKGQDSLSSLSPFKATISSEGLKIDRGALRIGNGKISLSGTISKEKTVNITGNNINIHFISTILSLKLPMSGIINFHSNIIGKGINITGKVENPEYKKFKGDSIIFAGNIFPDKIMLDKFVLYDKGKMKIEGIIPIKKWKLSSTGNTQLALDFTNTSGWIFIPFSKYIRFNGGNLTGSIGINGQIKNPFINGFLTLNNTSITIPTISTDVKEIHGVLSMNGKIIEINHLTGKIKTGKIDISGKGHFAPNPSYNFELQMEKIPFKGLRDVSAILDGNVNFSLTKKVPFIKGKIYVINAEITTPFKKKESITTYKREYYVDIKIDASNYNLWLRNNFANAELGGEIRVIHNKEKWNISGVLKTKQGKIFYLDREFSLCNGKFHFLNTQEINPEIYFLATTFVPPDDSIFLSVSGSMLSPKFNLYSKPPMSLDEIIALLNLNMRWDQLASLEEVESEVKRRAITYWVRKTLLKEIQSRVGLDMMSLEEGERTRLIIGKYFTRNFYVTYSTNVFSYETSNLHLEYRIGRWGNFIGEQNAEGKRRFIFQIRFRY